MQIQNWRPQIDNGQLERDNRVSQALRLPHPSHLTMLRFLKKHRKRFNKPVPPESPARQTADIGAEHGRGSSEGEYRSRKISELMRSMGLTRQRYQIPTTEGVLG